MANIENINFKQYDNQKEIDDFFLKRASGQISDEEYEKGRIKYSSYCFFSELIENNVVLYKIAKSSKIIAEASLEGHPFIPCSANSFMEDSLGEHGLSLTNNAAITYLGYGDLFLKITFPKQNIPQNLYNEKLHKTGGDFDEYIARCVWIDEVKPISDPKTLKEIILVSSDDAFLSALIASETSSWSPDAALKKFGLYNSYRYWKNIRNEWTKMEGYRISDANVLRSKLDEILEQTLKEIEREKHLFEHDNNENNQKYDSEINL